ncbi:putative ATP-dependent RNA helicase TDRD12 isoform X2 [Anolis carolinensis]|uniref:putative ATP-dependent RNA helicase TDRD12 isoform X2 n=1 Tax=Anolis carolinensis TaxID=28377 RepID=UPI002F2B5451
MFEVFIIKIESPDCFWGSIKGGGNFVDNEMAYKKLQFEMNQFYNLTHRGLDEVKPSVLKEGQVCVVYSQEENSWCRAIVESIISCTDNYLAECFLVDYAKNIPVKAEKICCALESFMRLPYRAQKFRLYHIKPVTLRVNYYTNNAEIVPATKWNIAAIRYFQDLLDAASQVEAKLCAVEDDTFAVYLYVTKRGEKVCVNDDLVAKNFASSEKNEERSIIMEEQNQEILGLESVSVSEISPAHILSPTSLDIKEPKAVEMCNAVSDDFEKSIMKILPEPASQNRDVMVAIPSLKPGVKVSVTELQTDSELRQVATGVRELALFKDVSQETPRCVTTLQGASLMSLHEARADRWELTPSRGFEPPTFSTSFKTTANAKEIEESLYNGNTSTKFEQRSATKEATEISDDIRLLQFLNPYPLKAADAEEETGEHQVNLSAHFPVVLSHKIAPCTSLEKAPLFPALKQELLRKKFVGPNHVQSYSWPAIARGYDSVVICPENDPLIYLLPIITFLQSRNCYLSLPARNGPVALIICTRQRKAELVFEFVEKYTHCSRPLHPLLLSVGMNKEEIKSVRIPRGCELIVTTPYSLLRLLECHSLMFLRLCHLVLDEAEALFSEANDQVFNILEHYKRSLNDEVKEYVPQQIVAIGSRWTKKLEYLTKEFMNDPYVVITSLEEAAIYGNIQQVVQVSLECNRISILLQTLDFTPHNAQKTLIFTSSVEETDNICKAVESMSVFCLKMHSKNGFQLDHVVEQWNKRFGSGTHAVLVLTDDCMPALGVTDATCVIHFSFPTSPRIFGARLYCMSDHFQTSMEKVSPLAKEQPKAKSILLLTENSAWHTVGVLDYLKRTEANIPPELHDFTSGVLDAKENCKSGKPFCRYLKVYGFCKDKKRCPDRHRISLQVDFPKGERNSTQPTAGNVTILPLFIVDATNYFGRIVDKTKDQYTALEKEMHQYYKKSSNCISVSLVEKLALYGVHEKNYIHRVQVLQIAPKEGKCVFYSIHVKYIDEGRTGQVQNYQLLSLPEHFQVLPPQAVEFIVCRVKPIDNEAEWNPKVNRYINHKIKGQLHEAKIVHTLNNTIWVDPVVRVTKLPDLKTYINEYNIRSEILATGFGVDNPEHICELQRLFREAEIAFEKKDMPALNGPLKGETSEQATWASLSIFDQTTPNSQTTEEPVLPSVQNTKEKDAAIIKESDSQVTLPNHCNGMVQREEGHHSLQPADACLHPAIKWFEKEDVVVLKIKVQNITNHDCKFFTQRIMFSGSAEGKFYLADLELQENIVEEKSRCVLRGNEVVVSLAKEKKGSWCRLLKQKNPHVSFDFDYLEDDSEESGFPISDPEGMFKAYRMSWELEQESFDESETDSDASTC